MTVKDCSWIDQSDLHAKPFITDYSTDTFIEKISSEVWLLCFTFLFGPKINKKYSTPIKLEIIFHRPFMNHDADKVWSPLQSHMLFCCWKSAVCLSIGIMACIVRVHVGRMCFSLPLLCFCSAVMSRHGLTPFSSRLLTQWVCCLCVY